MFGRIALVVASLLCGLLVLELGCRAARGPQALLHWQNIVLGQRQAMARQNLESRFLYDPQLGYVPTPGFRSKAAASHLAGPIEPLALLEKA